PGILQPPVPSRAAITTLLSLLPRGGLEEREMIFKKFFGAVRAQLNKLANFFWEADPIAQMQYEYDSAVEQLKEGRAGVEAYRGLVQRGARAEQGGEGQ